MAAVLWKRSPTLSASKSVSHRIISHERDFENNLLHTTNEAFAVSILAAVRQPRT